MTFKKQKLSLIYITDGWNTISVESMDLLKGKKAINLHDIHTWSDEEAWIMLHRERFGAWPNVLSEKLVDFTHAEPEMIDMYKDLSERFGDILPSAVRNLFKTNPSHDTIKVKPVFGVTSETNIVHRIKQKR